MKKNFLLMFLMALLPLAGWAADIADVSIVASNVYYGQSMTTQLLTNVPLDAGNYTIADAIYDENKAVTAYTNTANLPVGTYYVRVDGNNAYDGTTAYAKFLVNPRDLTGATVAAFTAKSFTGSAVEYDETDFEDKVTFADPALTLVIGTDYDVTYTANTNASTTAPTITFTGKGNYTGTTTKVFTINPVTLVLTGADANATAVLDQTTFTFNAGAQEATATVAAKSGAPTLTEDDWVLYYNGNTTNAGTYNVYIRGKGNWTSDNLLLGTVTINPATLTVEASATRAYNGVEGWSTLDPNNGDVTPTVVGWQGDDETNIGVAGITVEDDAYSLVDATVKNAEAYSYINVDKTKFSIAGNTNYAFNGKSTGKLTITKAAVPTITFSDELTKDKGVTPTLDEVKAVLTVGGGAIATEMDAIKAAVTDFTIGTEADANGKYTITLTVNTDAAVFANYDMTDFAAGTGKIKYNNATLYISMKTASLSKLTKVYDGEEASLADISADDFDVDGWVAGDETDLTITPSFAAAGEHKDAANYVVDFAVTGAPAGYEVEISSAAYKITKAPLTVTMPAKSVEAGQTITAAEETLTTDGIVIEGLKKGETAADIYDLSLKPTLATEQQELVYVLINQTVADGYILTLKAAYSKNYWIAQGTDPETYADNIAGKLIVGTGDVTPVALVDYSDIVAKDLETIPVSIDFNTRTRAINATAAKHTWTAGNWNALVLPFDIDVAELSNLLGSAGVGEYNYVVVNTVKPNSEAGKFQFQLAMGTIPANTPIMVKTVNDVTANPATATITGVISFGSKTIEAPESATVEASAGNGFKLVGKYENFVLDKTSTVRDAEGNALYKFMYGDDDSQYRYFSSTSANSWTIVPFDCYVDLSGDAGAARNVIFEFEEPNGNTTAITSISVDLSNASRNAEGWYNLNGLKLQTAPTQKGVYIKDGKKFIVK